VSALGQDGDQVGGICGLTSRVLVGFIAGAEPQDAVLASDAGGDVGALTWGQGAVDGGDVEAAGDLVIAARRDLDREIRELLP
jgi:hypothetical protein